MGSVRAGGISPAAVAKEQGEHTITLVGEGQASAVPDRARLSVGVNTSSVNVGEAAQANRSSMQKMLQALTDLGIEERAMATSNFSIHFEKPRKKAEDREGIYRVSNMLPIELGDLEQIDSVIEEAYGRWPIKCGELKCCFLIQKRWPPRREDERSNTQI